MFVVTGVTGHTGSVVASTLLAQKQPVRVVVRDAAKGARWREQGADVVVASLDDTAALTEALRGASGAYLMVPPVAAVGVSVPVEQKRVGESIVAAVRAARPAHVVFLSSVGVQHDAGTGPIKLIKPVEQGLAASGVPVTFLRAAFFQENWGSMAADAIASGALHYGARADLKFPQVATVDIGQHAARLLLDPVAHGTRVVELSGPAEWSLEDVAAMLSRIGGKPVKAVTVPIAGMVEAMVSRGAPAEMAALYGEMLDGLNRGVVDWEGGRAIAARGRVSVEDTLRTLVAKPA